MLHHQIKRSPKRKNLPNRQRRRQRVMLPKKVLTLQDLRFHQLILR